MSEKWIDLVTCPECGELVCFEKSLTVITMGVFVCNTCVRWWSLEQEFDRLRYKKYKDPNVVGETCASCRYEIESVEYCFRVRGCSNNSRRGWFPKCQ